MRTGRSAKEGRDLGVDAQAAHRRAHARLVLAARLLHDDQMRARGFGGRSSIAAGTTSDMMRAPCEPPVTRRPQPAVGEIGKGDRRRLDHRRPHRIAGQVRLGGDGRRRRRRSRSKPVAMASTRRARKRLARPITAFCSCRTVGTPRCVAASTGGTRRIAAKADERERAAIRLMRPRAASVPRASAKRG